VVKKNGVYTIALVGGKSGKLAALADYVVVIGSAHYGRVEDAHMTICQKRAMVYSGFRQVLGNESKRHTRGRTCSSKSGLR
jgi:hypothetical protein